MKHKFCLIVFLFILAGCEGFFIKDKEFSINVTPYAGNELNIDGYYYKNNDNGYSNVLVFYANGVQFGGNGMSVPTNEIETKLIAPDFTITFSYRRDCWGPFEINNNVLRFEFYDIFGSNWHTCIAHCEILNDTTFYVEKITFSKTGKEVNVNMESTSFYSLGEWHFKQFSHKPDSTNNFLP